MGRRDHRDKHWLAQLEAGDAVAAPCGALRARLASGASVTHPTTAAVLAAYGWPADISEGEVLARLLELNLTRTPA